MPTFRILIVDDQETVRNGIRSLLSARPDLSICGEAADGLEAVEKARQLRPDLVLMDISMPRMDGVQATKFIRNEIPSCGVIAISQNDATVVRRQAEEMDASGYLTKSDLSSDLLSTIDQALANSDRRKNQALRESEERFRTLADNMSQLAWTCDLLGNVTWYNKRWLDYTGLSFEQMKGWGWSKVQHPDHVDRVVERVRRSAETGEAWEDTFPLRGKDGQYRWFLSRAMPIRDDQGMFVQWFGTNTDITERRRATGLVDSLRQALQLLAEGTELDQVLEFLINIIQQNSDDGTLAAITLLNGEGTHFERGIGPDLPRAFHLAVAGVPVSSPSGICANAVRRREAVAVADFNAEPMWRPFGDFVAPYGLRSGWSAPIVSSSGQVLATFASYYRHTGDPTPRDREMVETVIRTAAIAIERARVEYSLRDSEEKLRALAEDLEVQVQARTGELKAQKDEVESQAEQLRELSGRLLRAQDNERRNLARDLHDTAGQMLTALLMMTAGIVQQAKKDAPQLAKAAEESEQLMRQLNSEIRTTSYLLHPPLLDEAGLSEALGWYIRGLNERSGLEVDLNISENLGRLPNDMELAIFRLVQESLTNVHRHSGTTRARLSIVRNHGHVLVEVADEGKGISQEKLKELQAKGAGVGIQGMRERIRLFGGQMNIESNGRGTTIRVMIPIEDTGYEQRGEIRRA